MRWDSDSLRSSRAVALLVAAMSLATARPTAAQPAEKCESTPDMKEQARGLVGVGNDRLLGGNAKGALAAYLEADRLVCSVPTTLLLVGRAQMQLGMLVEARDTYQRIRNYPKRDNEPEPFVSARAEAEQSSREVADRIPSVQVQVETAKGPLPKEVADQVEVKIGQVAATGMAALELPRRVNPGEHELTVSAPRFHTQKMKVSVKEKERRSVKVVLVEDPNWKPPAATPAPRARPAERDERDEGTPGWAAPLVFGGLGVGLAGIIIGSVFGGLSLAAAGEAKDACEGRDLSACPSAARDPHDRADTLGWVSNVGFGFGVVGLGVGITALALHPEVLFGGGDDAAPEPEDKASARLRLGPTSVTVMGSF